MHVLLRLYHIYSVRFHESFFQGAVLVRHHPQTRSTACVRFFFAPILNQRMNSEKSWFYVPKNSHLHNEDLSLNLLNDFLLFVIGAVSINVQGSLYILMPHHRLDHLEIGFVLAESCAEGMS